MTRDRASRILLLSLAVLAAYFCFLLIVPFIKPVIFSAILTVLFFPLHSRIRRLIRNETAAALLSTISVLLVIALPSIVLGQAIATGLRDLYQTLAQASDGRERLALYIIRLLARAGGAFGGYFGISISELRPAILSQAEKGVSILIGVSASVLGSITSLIANGSIAFFVLFFFFRDGEVALRRAAIALPTYAGVTSGLFARISDTLNAIVYGTLFVAALQGALTGIAFWILGVGSAVLWAVVTSLCALLPVFGTAIVLLPAISMLLYDGHWIKALILVVWALTIVHPVDNFLRPFLIGGRVKLSTLYIFFAILGGLKAFGALGVFIGPVILATALALFRFLIDQKVAEGWVLDREPEPVPSQR